MTRLPAFTIMEVMVTALLSVITVGIALSAWQIIERQFSQYSQETEEALSVGQLNMLLQRDFLQCSQAVREEDALRFSFPAYEVLYLLEAERIVRKLANGDGRDDVFNFAPVVWSTAFRGQEVLAGPIDFAAIQVLWFEKPMDMAFSRTYSAKELMQPH